jgi:hypothetical protein
MDCSMRDRSASSRTANLAANPCGTSSSGRLASRRFTLICVSISALQGEHRST